MKCKHCGGKTHVYGARQVSDSRTLRYRICLECGYKFRTIEELREKRLYTDKVDPTVKIAL